MNNNLAQNKIYHIKNDALETNQPNNNRQLISNNVKSKSKDINKKNNSLSGLLAHYNSDSENEENENKLDVKVDSFLQEINEIKPQPITPSTTTTWQECFDSGTGYAYYWNMETNQVTWEMPPNYAKWLESQNSIKSTEVHSINIEIKPPLPEIIRPKKEEPVKLINDEEVINEVEEKKDVKPIKKKRIQTKPAKSKRPSTDSDDEKIELITSFCEDSTESESEATEKIQINEQQEEKKVDSPLPVLGPYVEDMPKEIQEKQVPREEKREIIETVKEDVDETVILARLRTQAKVLQELDGELPESVEKFLGSIEKTDKTQSLSLVAGYGDESDEEVEEVEEEKKLTTIFPVPKVAITSNNTTAESTLFPITQPIDIKQFSLPKEEEVEEEKKTEPETSEENSVDTKLFKRKKRIAFDVLPTMAEKKAKVNEPDERRGFGFKTEDSNSNEGKSFINFQKGGVVFVKSDEPEKSSVQSDEKVENFSKIKDIVSEKVQFLCEGKNEVSAVQIMFIQLNTLEAAYKAGGLSSKYLSKWLHETSTDLAKLEKEAAPQGWICQWDRSHKRYFYHNQHSGETQWDYPAPVETPVPTRDPDIIGGGEEMDICTTPPPGEEAELVLAQKEEPSKTRMPSPPPPPIITVTTGVDHTKEDYNPPLPPPTEEVPPPPPPPSISQDQPLPPGVDPVDSDHVVQDKTKSNKDVKRNSFGTELDSFYSDLAKIEATTTGVNIDVPPVINVENSDLQTTEIVKKKKKSKPKIGQRLTMKKKNVSTLVEKWKKVQNDFL